jgi:hypothetical protein
MTRAEASERQRERILQIRAEQEQAQRRVIREAERRGELPAGDLDGQGSNHQAGQVPGRPDAVKS